MNDYLLDTHIWIWSLISPSELSKKVVGILRHEECNLWLSPISIWETLILIEKKRIKVNSDKKVWVEKALQLGVFKQAPLSYEVALSSRSFESSHQDPADLFIAATAKVYALTLITSDRALANLSEIKVLLN